MSEKPHNIIIKKRKHQEHATHSTAWKIALADFMTTLMILFFVLWIISLTPADKKKALVSFFKGKHDPSSLVQAPSENGKKDDSNSMMGSVYFSLSSELSELKNQVKINLGRGRIELNMESNVFFDSGGATVKKKFYDTLKRVAHTISNKNLYIDVYGYTDNLPLKNDHVLKNNLNLSIARAQEVADLLIKYGVPDEDVGIHGEGERFPVASNKTEAGRAKNRRIVIYMSPKRESAQVKLFGNDKDNSQKDKP